MKNALSEVLARRAVVVCCAVVVFSALLAGWPAMTGGTFGSSSTKISGYGESMHSAVHLSSAVLLRSPAVTGYRPTLTLTPNQGGENAEVTAHGRDYGEQCRERGHVGSDGSDEDGSDEDVYQYKLTWNKGENSEKALGVLRVAGRDEGGNGFRKKFKVPSGSMGGQHKVVAECGDEIDGNASADAVFTVPSSPTLVLRPEKGEAGDRLTVEGRGYSSCNFDCTQNAQPTPVEVFWDDEEVATAAMGNNGEFIAEISVPRTAEVGSRHVVARFGAETASKVFEVVEPPSVGPSPVESSPVHPPPADPPETNHPVLRLVLIPDEGDPGDPFKIEGFGYNECPDRGNRVVNIYDRNIPDSDGFSLALARNIPISGRGTFSVTVRMPATAAQGRHQIDARCFGGDEAARAFFTVTGLAGPPSGESGSSPGDFGSAPGRTNPAAGSPLPLLELPPDPPSGPPAPLPGPAPAPEPGSEREPGAGTGSGSGSETGSGSGTGTGPGAGDDQKVEDGEQYGNGRPNELNRTYLAVQVAEISASLDRLSDPTELLLGVLLAVFLIFIVAFPAEIFNSTFEKNRAEIQSWFRWVPRPSRLNLPSWVHLTFFGFVSAVLLMVVVPEIGLDGATLAQAVGFLVAVLLVVVALEVPGGLYSRRRGKKSSVVRPGRKRNKQRGPRWRVLPSALVVAGFLAVLSRLADLSPPYVYGLVAVYIVAGGHVRKMSDEERRQEEGCGVLIGMLCVITLSLVAWFAWYLLDGTLDMKEGELAFQNGTGLLVADAVFATVFLLGLETAIFGMIPLAFLKGRELYRWRRSIWVMVFFPLVFAFVNIQSIVREASDLTLPVMMKAVALFVAFGIFSFAFWGYFHPNVRRLFPRSRRQPPGQRVSRTT